jgi:gliding motility-associated-like protein
MIVQIKRITILLWIFCLPGLSVFSQHSSKNNYTGAWATPASWSPTWAFPQTIISGYNITINGYITVNGSLSFTGGSGNLIINDTLVIKGDLFINNNNSLSINDNGILIVRGNLIIHNHANLIANGYLIITGYIDKHGPNHEGSLTSNDNPVKVFVGGAIYPGDLTDNEPDYPALNCTAPITIPYSNTACSYGNMTDIESDPIYSFFQHTCTIANAHSNSPVCAGNTINLTSSGGIVYSWSGPNSFTSNAQNPSRTNASIAMAGDYIVTVTAVTGCKVKDTTNVTVNPLPIPTLAGPTPVCVGVSGNIYTTEAGMSNYIWTVSAGGTITAGGGVSNNTVTVTWTTTGAKTVTVNYTNGNGCTATSPTTYNVTVNPISVATAGNNGPICAGNALNLTGGPSGMIIYSWTGPNGFTSLLQNPSASANATLAMAGNYTLTVTNASGCISTGTSTVTVNALPIATASSNGPVCASSALNLTGGPAGMITYSWTGPSEFISLLQNPSVSANATLAMAGVYTLIVTNASGCTNTVTTTVKVDALPLVNITSSNSSMCVNDLRTLTGSPTGGTFIVTDGPGTIRGNVLSATGIGNINLEYNYTDVCANMAAQSIIVNDNPIANAGTDQELNFIFETNMEAELFLSETGEWSLISGSGYISDIHSPTTGITDLSIGENKFLWKVQDGNCEASAEVKITVNDLFVPSVITPNNDGKNDYFMISENIDRVELIIFNSWGNEVYTNGNYLNDWDGRNNKGMELPNDTYFYILKFENGKIKKGSVLIKR